MSTSSHSPRPGHDFSADADPLTEDLAAAAPPREPETVGFTAADTANPAASADPTASAPGLRPRFGTILWGVLLLAFALFMAAAALFPGALDPTWWLLGGVITVGVVLVIAGILAAVRRVD